MSFSFESPYQKKLIKELQAEWSSGRSNVFIIQGFPGTGKTRVIQEFTKEIGIDSIFLSLVAGDEDLFDEFFLELASAMENRGVDLLSRINSSSSDRHLLEALTNLIVNEEILIVINEFQNCFNKDGNPKGKFIDLIVNVNKHLRSTGKIFLVINRRISHQNWTEGSHVVSIEGIPEAERRGFLDKALAYHKQEEKVPKDRRDEIMLRLGGNPRAALILISALYYENLEGVLSLKPDLFEIGDGYVYPDLIAQFERNIIQRSITQMDGDLRGVLNYLSVYRKPFYRELYRKIPFENIDSIRRNLIDRYFLFNSIEGDALHPVAREVFISKLKLAPENFVDVNSFAADYYLSIFKLSNRSRGDKIYTKYFELRHHLTASDRLFEMGAIDKRIRTHLLSRITKPKQSQVPDRELMEERIALISLIPDNERPKELEYHLALCLRARNKSNDYNRALNHIRRAESNRIYYAAWLLRFDLEYHIDGIDSMLAAFEKGVRNLKSNNNVFALYRRCSEILHKDGKTNLAIDILKRGLHDSGVQNLTSLAPLCADYMVEQNRSEEAVSMLLNCIHTKGVTRVATLYKKCSELMASEGLYMDAKVLIEEAIDIPEITKIYSLRIQLAHVVEKISGRMAAIKVLKEGIDNIGSEDASKLLVICSEMMAEEGLIEDAIALLEKGLLGFKKGHRVKLIISLHEKLILSGQDDKAIDLLNQSLLSKSLGDKKIIYLKLSDFYFRRIELDKSLGILKSAILDEDISDRWEIYKKFVEIRCRLGQVDEAISDVERFVLDRNVSNIHMLYKEGSKFLVKEKRFDDAIRLIKSGLDSSISDRATLYQELAYLFRRVEDYSSAIDTLETAISEPGIGKIADLYKKCAELYEFTGNPEKAIYLIDYAVSNISLGNLAPLYKLACEISVKNNNFYAAHDFIVNGIERYPNNSMLKDCEDRLLAGNLIFTLNDGGLSNERFDTTISESIRRIEYFKHFIEYQDGYKNLYYKNERRADEAFVQLFFKAVWFGSESSVDSEVKNGRGIVDFKISRGSSDCTVIEFKLGNSGSLKRNIQNQTEIYKLVNNTTNAITVIFVFTIEDQERVDNILKQTNKNDDDLIYVVDARSDNKPSASVAKLPV